MQVFENGACHATPCVLCDLRAHMSCDHGVLQEIYVLPKTLSKANKQRTFQFHATYNDRCENRVKVHEILILKTICVMVTPRSWIDVKKLPLTNLLLVNNHVRFSRNNVYASKQKIPGILAAQVAG